MNKSWIILFLICTILPRCTKDRVSDNGSEQLGYTHSGTKPFDVYTYLDYQPSFFVKGLTQDPNESVLLPPNSKNAAVTNEKASLGRLLFYDKLLSSSRQVSCGSCHVQSKAFTDGLALSKGHSGESTVVSSMSIQNLAFQNNYFWNSRVQNIQDLVVQPLINTVEMGNRSMGDVVKKINATGYYKELFIEAFGLGGITESTVADALASFVQSIYSSDSKFDQGLKSDFQNFTKIEKEGMALFNGKAQCNHCHSAPTFAAADFAGGTYGPGSNASIATNVLIPNKGDGRTNNGLDLPDVPNKETFRIPTLRNIAVTGPFMHDGRFNSLADVIDHYDHGIVFNEFLDNVLVEPNKRIAKRLNLTRDEKNALLAFLHTLTDQTLLTATRYSDPNN